MRKVLLLVFLYSFFYVSTQAQVPAYIPAGGLVAWYPFSCNANDLGAYKNNGAIHDATPTADRFGNPNSAYYFNGVNNYIAASGIAAFDFGNKLSLSVWVKLDDRVNKNHDIICAIVGWQHSETRAGFNIVATGEKMGYAFSLSDGPSTVTDEAPDSLTTGTWHNIVAVYDGAHMYLYRDGELISTKPCSPELAKSGQLLNIGSGEGTLRKYFKGSIDDIAIWKRALSATEVARVYSSSGVITGPSAVGMGQAIQLVSSVTGGTWHSSSPSIASVSGDGLVRGVSGGRATIWYAIPDDCGGSMVIAQMPLHVGAGEEAPKETPKEVPKEIPPPAKPVERLPEKTPELLPTLQPRELTAIPAEMMHQPTLTVPRELPPVVNIVIMEAIDVRPLAHIRTLMEHMQQLAEAEVPPMPELQIPDLPKGPSEEFSIAADAQQQELTINTEPGAYNYFTITTTANKVLIKQPITQAHTKVDLSLLPSANYYLLLEKDGKVKSTMFVKQ